MTMPDGLMSVVSILNGVLFFFFFFLVRKGQYVRGNKINKE